MACQAEPGLAVWPGKPRASTFTTLVITRTGGQRSLLRQPRRAESITSCCAWICMQIAFAQHDLIKDGWGGIVLL